MQNNRYRNNRDRRPVSRGYQSRKPRREKIAPQPPKPCVVIKGLSQEMNYDKDGKKLYYDGQAFFFPSKRAAHTAIWHTVQQSGEPGSHVNYRIEEI